MLAGSPRTITDRLQHLPNAAARVVSNTGKFDLGLTHLFHSELHWLDVHSGSSISSVWQFTSVSKAGLPSTSWTAATHIGCCQSSATLIFQPPPSRRTTTSSQHARSSGVLRHWSDGFERAAWRPPKPVAQCRQFQKEAKDASVSECTWTLSTLLTHTLSLSPFLRPFSEMDRG